MDTMDNDLALGRLGEQLMEWRSTHHAPARIPEELWASAVGLATEMGACKVSRALRLGYASLRKRMKGQSLTAVRPDTAFVEWLPSLASNISECSLELESKRGAKVRVQMKNVSAPSLSSVLRDLLA